MQTIFSSVIPVLPSADIARDTAWYVARFDFNVQFADKMYAVLYAEDICIHLQWHADTADDPLLGGSVIRIYMKDIMPLFENLVAKGLIKRENLIINTPWGTNEFGMFDLNQNAVFVMEDSGSESTSINSSSGA